ncbi:hypothetical protein DPMN_004485 [Dreissena polymorpha]|uniref:Uncharacterized protein n=1 Tax=Dreissena polymorpha TaxID=45954 RepID=A0A9D4MQB2_DREPO|nr:hypothetical protein DPMN_004485 [Dreissena polymorpha]
MFCQDFEIPSGESLLVLEGPGFPIRSQCIAVLTRCNTGDAHADDHPRARNHVVAMETDGYQVTFEGCSTCDILLQFCANQLYACIVRKKEPAGDKMR